MCLRTYNGCGTGGFEFIWQNEAGAERRQNLMVDWCNVQPRLAWCEYSDRGLSIYCAMRHGHRRKGRVDLGLYSSRNAPRAMMFWLFGWAWVSGSTGCVWCGEERRFQDFRLRGAISPGVDPVGAAEYRMAFVSTSRACIAVPQHRNQARRSQGRAAGAFVSRRSLSGVAEAADQIGRDQKPEDLWRWLRSDRSDSTRCRTDIRQGNSRQRQSFFCDVGPWRSQCKLFEWSKRPICEGEFAIYFSSVDWQVKAGGLWKKPILFESQWTQWRFSAVYMKGARTCA